MRSEFAHFAPVFDRAGKRIGYRAFVSRGKRPDGSRNRKTVTVRGSLIKAKAEARAVWEGLGNPKARPQSKTLGEHVAEWIEHEAKNPRVRAETLRDYESKMRLYVTPVLGDRDISTITAEDVDRLTVSLYSRLTLRQPKKGIRHLSHTTVRQVWRVWRIAMKVAVRWERIARSPFDGLTAPAAPSRTPETLTEAEALDYLAAFRGHEIELAVLAMLGCGLRRSEAFGADRECFRDGSYRLHRTLQQRAGTVYWEPLKTSASRAVTPIVIPAVNARIIELGGEGPLVPDGEEPMRPDKIVDLYDARVAEAGLRRVPMMALRHSFANVLKGRGVSVYVVSMLMRHASVTTTQKYYFDDEIPPMPEGVSLDGLFA